MENVFITSVIGPIVPDIIKSLAEVTRRFEGEW